MEIEKKAEGKGRVIIGIVMAVIMLASIFGVMIGGIGAYTVDGNNTQISAEKTSCIEFETVKLMVTGVQGDDINVASSPLTPHVIFIAGVEDTPVNATNQFNHTIDADGVRTYAVKFNDTGTFTIKVTVTDSHGAGRDGEYDTVNITVSEKAITFDLPMTVVIGDKFTMKGTTNTGETVDIYVDGKLYRKLDDLVIEDGEFSEEVTADEYIGMGVPSTVRLKAWIDSDIAGTSTGTTVTPSTPADGEAAFLLTEPKLDASQPRSVITEGEIWTVEGTATGVGYVDIILVGPKGWTSSSINDIGIDKGFYLTSVSVYDNEFTEDITMEKGIDTGLWIAVILHPGCDGEYTRGPITPDNLYGYGVEPGMNQSQILDGLEDGLSQDGSDDLWVILAFQLEAAPIYVPDNYTKIQWAVDNATEGDTIIVRDGTYLENVDVDKSDIIIRSDNGSSVTIVKSNTTDMHVFSITDQANITLEGFTIRDAYGTGIQDVAGIYMYNASECNISDNFVTNISATKDSNAHGIWLDSSNNNEFSSSTNVSYISATNASNAYGIRLIDSDDNKFSSSTNVSYINTTYGDDAYGICLGDSDNNKFSSSTNVSYIDANGNACGIELGSSNNNSFSSSTTISYLNATWEGARGILLGGSSNNRFSSSTTVSNINATEEAFGIGVVENSNNNSFSSSIVSYINATNASGILLAEGSNNNSFSSSTEVSYVNATHAIGIVLVNGSNDNRFSSSTTVSNINATEEAFGIGVVENSNNNSFSSSIVSYINATHDAFGILLVDDSNNNSFSSSTEVSYLNATNASGILLVNGSNDNRFSSSTTVSNINASNNTWGINLYESDNNEFSDSTDVSYINATYEAFGIGLFESNNNSFSSTTTVKSVHAGEIAIGIGLFESNDNSFSDSTDVSYINGSYINGNGGGGGGGGGGSGGSGGGGGGGGGGEPVGRIACGIKLMWSSDNEFNDSTNVSYINASAHACGIVLEYDSDNNEFYYCTISDLNASVPTTSYGVYMIESSDNNTISRAKIFRGSGPPINFGVYMEWCSNNSITENVIRDNGHGIYLESSDDNQILYNDILANQDPDSGIHLGSNCWGNVIHFNNIVGNDYYGVKNDNTSETVDAENNWWGDPSGPCDDAEVINGTGDKISTAVDADPWLGQSHVTPIADQITTATGTGTASFSTDGGAITDLTAVDEADLPSAGKPNVNFPHGFFSFNIIGLAPCEMVNVTITLPSAVPVGTQYWKCQASTWCQIPTGDDDGDTVITITLVDGGTGDDDEVCNGVIVDPGGPGAPTPTPTPTPTRRGGGGGGAPRDSDGDGYSDIDEMLAGTDQNDSNDYPGAPAVTPTPTPTPTPVVTVTPTIPPAVTPTPTPTPPVKPPVKIPWALIIGIIIAVIVVGAAAYYIYTKKKA